MTTGTILLIALVIGAPLLMMLIHRGGHGMGCGGHNHGGDGEPEAGKRTASRDPQK